jgi:DNA-binding NtrC family response regulator
VRQLRNAIELVTILRSGKTVRVHDLPPGFDRVADPVVPASDTSLSIDLDQPLTGMIDHLVRHVIAMEHGDLARAARRLGVSVRTLQRRRRA